MIFVRNAVSDDALVIAEVQVRSWVDTYTGLLPSAVLENMSVEESRDRFLEAIEGKPKEHVYVAEDDGRVFGFAVAGPSRDAGSDAVGEVYALYVLQDYQGMGTGTRLFRKAVDDLAGKGFVSLVVRVLSGNSYCRFYEKHGGTEVEARDEDVGGQLMKLRIFRWDRMPLRMDKDETMGE